MQPQLIEMDGQRLLTDPVLRNELMHLRRRNKQIDPPGAVISTLS
jgi:L-ascorbate metabolism protein UlaG (beta-lactamase superfamily)